jgi:hypothetical protein
LRQLRVAVSGSEKLVAEAVDVLDVLGSRRRGTSALKAATKQGLVKTDKTFSVL